MLNDLLYVLAINYEEARDYAYKQGCHYSRMVNVCRPDKLRGLQNIVLHVLPLADERKNYGDIMREAKTRNIEIKYV